MCKNVQQHPNFVSIHVQFHHLTAGAASSLREAAAAATGAVAIVANAWPRPLTNVLTWSRGGCRRTS